MVFFYWFWCLIKIMFKKRMMIFEKVGQGRWFYVLREVRNVGTVSLYWKIKMKRLFFFSCRERASKSRRVCVFVFAVGVGRLYSGGLFQFADVLRIRDLYFQRFVNIKIKRISVFLSSYFGLCFGFVFGIFILVLCNRIFREIL